MSNQDPITSEDAYTSQNLEDIFVPQQEPDIHGLISEAIRVKGADNNDLLRRAAEAESRGESNPELQTVMDAIIGVKLLGIKSNDEDIVRNTDAVIVKALSGDERDQAIVEQGLATLHAHNPGRARMYEHKEWLTEQGQSDENIAEIYSSPESLSYEHLSIVHATSHLPVSDKRGVKRIEDRFTGSGHARSTVHVALNAQVESSFFSADWSQAPFIVVAPMDEVVDQNGEPTSLIGHDTWWEVLPGRGLELPEDTIIIMPGSTRPVQYLPGSKEVRYKNQGITQEDVDELTHQAGDYELSLISEILGIKLNLDYNYGTNKQLANTKLDQYETALTPEQRLEVINSLKDRLKTEPESGLAAYIDLAKRVAVRVALEAQGREVIEPRTTMESSFMSSDIDEELRRLSLNHSANAGHHSESTVGRLERSIRGLVQGAKFTGDEAQRKSLVKEIRDNIDNISNGTLQMYYRLGLL